MSAIVRIILCVSGGQDYWPDEPRHNPDRILQPVIEGDYRGIFSGIDDPDRPVFTVLAVVPAAISRATGHGPIVRDDLGEYETPLPGSGAGDVASALRHARSRSSSARVSFVSI